MFWYLIADFEIKEELKHVNQLKNMSKKIPTKYGKYELWTRSWLNQTCINQIHAMNNHNILINGKEK